MGETKHTEGKLRIEPTYLAGGTVASGLFNIVDSSGAIWAKHLGELEAKEFVHRYNCHEDLLAACKKAYTALTTLDRTAIEEWDYNIDEIEALNAAIAKADRGEQGETPDET